MGAIRIELDPDGSTVTLGTDGAVDGRSVSADRPVTIRYGSVVEVGSLVLEVRGAAAAGIVPVRLDVEASHRTARVVAIDAAGSVVTVAVSELRGRLISVLLAAGADVAVPDERLIPALWPRSVTRTRLDVNQLVHRTRRDLIRAGIDGPRLLVRHPAGGATTLRLAG
jgi:hypothetical protein